MQISSCWDEATTLNDSLEILEPIALYCCQQAGEEGLLLARLIKSRDWKSLCSYEVDYSKTWDLSHLIHVRQVLGFYTKLEDLDIGVDKKSVAWSKFVESERQCSVTNDLFRKFLHGSVNLRPCDVRVLYAARRKIRTVLGRCPKISELKLRLGPGATTAIKRRDACPQNKFAAKLACSDNLFHSGLVPEILRSMPHLADCHAVDSWEKENFTGVTVDLVLQPGRLEFVPKNASTYRAIVVEPLLNSVVQLGIGDFIALRLRRVGLDIRDQARNKRLAREGSISGGLATLDLSNASDTISRGLVKFLLPEEWFSLLNAVRSNDVSYKKTVIHQEKFSSMGNGFTFPLETLIFWALTVSSLPSLCSAIEDVTVYGDDIICPSPWADAVIHTLTICGFTVNPAKSFIKGPFRESCGGDYYLGVDIRPYYQKHLVSGQTLFTFHNFCHRGGYPELELMARNAIPRALRIYGPDGYGDGHLVSDEWHRVYSKKLLGKGFCGCSFETFSAVTRNQISRFPGDYVSPLYSIYTKDRVPVFDNGMWGLFDSTPLSFAKDGRPIWSLPGCKGYRRMKIYTFA